MIISGEIRKEVGIFLDNFSLAFVIPSRKDKGKIINKSHIRNYLSAGKLP